MSSIFGTDGIRGKFGSFPVDCDTFFRIGIALANMFKSGIALIAQDTRSSSNSLENALSSGLYKGGMNPISIGVLPTSSLAFLVPKFKANIGLMISASHNAYYDNGLKFFLSNGRKFTKIYEEILEASLNSSPSYTLYRHDNTSKNNYNALNDYIHSLRLSIPENADLSNAKIIVDVANGAAKNVAKPLFESFGTKVTICNNMPDGKNINYYCGSNHPENIKNIIIEKNADFGICLDGDADRVVICDENGKIVDGDQVIASLGLFLKQQKLLTNNNIVSTVISSVALSRFFSKHEINLTQTNVGECNVLCKMDELDCNFGAENSGHFIFKDYLTTSDGLLTALQVLFLKTHSELPLSKLMNHINMPMKIVKNIHCQKEVDSKIIESIQSDFEYMNDIHLIIRKSGTERGLIRIFLEGDDVEKMDKIMSSIIKSILVTDQA